MRATDVACVKIDAVVTRLRIIEWSCDSPIDWASGEWVDLEGGRLALAGSTCWLVEGRTCGLVQPVEEGGAESADGLVEVGGSLDLVDFVLWAIDDLPRCGWCLDVDLRDGEAVGEGAGGRIDVEASTLAVLLLGGFDNGLEGGSEGTRLNLELRKSNPSIGDELVVPWVEDDEWSVLAEGAGKLEDPLDLVGVAPRLDGDLTGGESTAGWADWLADDDPIKDGVSAYAGDVGLCALTAAIRVDLDLINEADEEPRLAEEIRIDLGALAVFDDRIVGELPIAEPWAIVRSHTEVAAECCRLLDCEAERSADVVG